MLRCFLGSGLLSAGLAEVGATARSQDSLRQQDTQPAHAAALVPVGTHGLRDPVLRGSVAIRKMPTSSLLREKLEALICSLTGILRSLFHWISAGPGH